MKWTLEEVQLLKDNYKYGTEFLSKKLNRSPLVITKKANRLELFISSDTKSMISKSNGAEKWKNNNYEYKVDDITNEINEYKSYILGLIWTDGYVLKKRNIIGVSLIKDDMIDIEWIFNNLGNWYTQDRKRSNKRESRTISVYNPKLTNILINNYDYDKKSYVSPNKVSEIIPLDYLKYFFRGIIDGDGCFYINKKNSTYQFSISSTYEQDWTFFYDFFKEMNIKSSIVRRHQGSSKSSIIRICGRKQILIFINWLYSGYEVDNIGMKRKYEKSLIFKNN